MSSERLKQAVGAAAVAILTLVTLFVVAGVVIKSTGPRADQLPQVSLSNPVDADVEVAEMTSPSTSSRPTLSSAPTTTTASVLGATPDSSGRQSKATSAGPAATVAHPTIARPATTRSPSPATTLRIVPSPVPTATTVPRTTVTTTERESDERTTTTLLVWLPTTTDHVVVPPTVRDDEDHDTD